MVMPDGPLTLAPHPERETCDATTLQGHLQRVERLLAEETANPKEQDARDQLARRYALEQTIHFLQVRLQRIA